MNWATVAFIAAILFCHCVDSSAQRNNGFILEGEIEGLKDNKVIYLILDADTVQQTRVQNGSFSFCGEVQGHANYYFLKFDSSVSKALSNALWLSNKKMHVSGNVKEPDKMVLKGSEPHDEYTAVIDFYKKNADRKLRDSFILRFIEDHKNSLYISDLIIKAAGLLKEQGITQAYNNLTLRAKESYYGKELRKMLSIEPVLRTGKIPDFSFLTPNGKTTSIYNAIAEYSYTLIDFWASWCTPCKAAFPELKRTYADFNKNGFNIIGISRDKNINEWKKAIKDEAILWDQGLDQVDDAGNNIFQLMSIPAYFIVDKTGRIVLADYYSKSGEIHKQIKGTAFSKNIYQVVKDLVHKCTIQSVDSVSETAAIKLADLYWETFPKRLSSNNKKVSSTQEATIEETLTHNNALLRLESINKCQQEEIYALQLRDWGIQFWNKFPADPRRFHWLKATLISCPNYFLDITKGAVATIERNHVVTLDTAARNQWEKKAAIFIQEALVSNQLKLIDKIKLLELQLVEVYRYRWRTSRNERFDIEKWTKEVIDYAKLVNDSLPSYINGKLLTITRNAMFFFNTPDDYGLQSRDLQFLVRQFQNSHWQELKQFADKMRSLLLLNEEPITIHTKDVNGNVFDLKKYRGKVVLLDFWGLGCIPCIKKMPEAKETWLKYRNRGFEVVSLCIIGYKYAPGKFGQEEFGISKWDEEKDKILKIHEKINADWVLVPLDYRPDRLGGKIFGKYNWSSVPQLLLLDEKGLLIEYNGSLLAAGGIAKTVADYFARKEDVKP